MKSKKPTYTLWNGPTLIDTYPHTREGIDAALTKAFDLGNGATIYSSRDDLIWSAMGDDMYSHTGDEAHEPSDAWHDADALASAGMGTDEDYGYYGDHDSGYDYL